MCTGKVRQSFVGETDFEKLSVPAQLRQWVCEIDSRGGSVTRIENWQNSTSFSDLESLGRIIVVVVRTPSGVNTNASSRLILL